MTQQRRRRTNKLTQTDALPDHKPVFIVDDFDSAMTLFLRDGKIRNISEHTTAFYRRELSRFRNMLERQGLSSAPEDITEHMIKENIILHMMNAELKETTINCTLRAARAMFNFLVRESYLVRSPMDKVSLVRTKRTIIQTFDDDQIKAILRQPDLTTFVGQRDYTIMLILLETGIRVRELTEIGIDDVRWADNQILINGKGAKERLVPIQATTKRQLRRWVTIRGELDTGSLFVTIDNEAVSIRHIQEQIQAYGRRANIKGVRCSPHTFRHTFARMSVQNGANIFALQAVLGHTSLEMVRRYVNLFSHDVQKDHRKFSPVERLGGDVR